MRRCKGKPEDRGEMDHHKNYLELLAVVLTLKALCEDWKPDPDAAFVDAFSANWYKFSFYTFPLCNWGE